MPCPHPHRVSTVQLAAEGYQSPCDYLAAATQNRRPSLSGKGRQREENQAGQRVNFLALSFSQKCYFTPTVCGAFLRGPEDTHVTSPPPHERRAAVFDLASL